jgi:hypothetical protein
MPRQLSAPWCHWPHCGRQMFLLNETPEFWFFQCECGTSRALTKPSARAHSLYRSYQNSVEQERQRRKWLASRPDYSIPLEVRR